MTDTKGPLVSAIVASYNHKPYVERAIKSLCDQDYGNIELLVIDDGSTDGSAELLKRLQANYKFRLISKNNGGLISSLNLGVSEISGEYVVFHASDDESLSTRISAQVEILERYKKAAFVSGNLSFITEKGRHAGTLLPVTGAERELGFDDLFLQKARVASVTSMYRAEALRAMGLLDASYRAEDPQIFWRLTRLGWTWIQWSGLPVLEYRLLSSSQSRTIMPLLRRQQLRLIDEFSDHPSYAEARRHAKLGLFSSLAEREKVDALRMLLNGDVNPLSRGAHRGLIKLVLPFALQRVFKRGGRLGVR